MVFLFLSVFEGERNVRDGHVGHGRDRCCLWGLRAGMWLCRRSGPKCGELVRTIEVILRSVERREATSNRGHEQGTRQENTISTIRSCRSMRVPYACQLVLVAKALHLCTPNAASYKGPYSSIFHSRLGLVQESYNENTY